MSVHLIDALGKACVMFNDTADRMYELEERCGLLHAGFLKKQSDATYLGDLVAEKNATLSTIRHQLEMASIMSEYWRGQYQQQTEVAKNMEDRMMQAMSMEAEASGKVAELHQTISDMQEEFTRGRLADWNEMEKQRYNASFYQDLCNRNLVDMKEMVSVIDGLNATIANMQANSTDAQLRANYDRRCHDLEMRLADALAKVAASDCAQGNCYCHSLALQRDNLNAQLSASHREKLALEELVAHLGTMDIMSDDDIAAIQLDVIDTAVERLQEKVNAITTDIDLSYGSRNLTSYRHGLSCAIITLKLMRDEYTSEIEGE